jgi:hypothetical protein
MNTMRKLPGRLIYFAFNESKNAKKKTMSKISNETNVYHIQIGIQYSSKIELNMGTFCRI